MDIKQGDRLSVVRRSHDKSGEIQSAIIYTVVRTTAKTGWLDNGEKFKLSDPFISLRGMWQELEPVTDAIEAANDRRIQKESLEQFHQSEKARLAKLVDKINIAYFNCLSPESVTRIADAIERELQP